MILIGHLAKCTIRNSLLASFRIPMTNFRSDLLTQEESFAILMNISAPGSWDLPDYLSKEREPRKLPRELTPGSHGEIVDLSSRYWCKRAMMQEPHCLNTSILDCSVTFTVDKDMCIHGIEVVILRSAELKAVGKSDKLGAVTARRFVWISR